MGADVVQCQCRAGWFTVARGGRAGLKYLLQSERAATLDRSGAAMYACYRSILIN